MVVLGASHERVRQTVRVLDEGETRCATTATGVTSPTCARVLGLLICWRVRTRFFVAEQLTAEPGWVAVSDRLASFGAVTGCVAAERAEGLRPQRAGDPRRQWTVTAVAPLPTWTGV